MSTASPNRRVRRAIGAVTAPGGGVTLRRGRPPRKKLQVSPAVAWASPDDFARWRADPVAFIEEVLVEPDTGAPFVLTEPQRIFIRVAFTLTPDGRLAYPELVFSGSKKSGKTTFGAMFLIYMTVVWGPRFAEAYCCSNDLEQSKGRVFEACRRIVASSRLLSSDAVIGAQQIVFRSSGATITALAADWRGAAGANPVISCFDELWGYTSEAAQRLWDEMVPPPTRRIACRLTVSYAGFAGESTTLEALYKRGLQGEQIAPDLYAHPGMLMFWTHKFTAPWQTEEWREQMRAQLRPNAFLRLVENRWVSGTESFVDIEAWDACVDPNITPVASSPGTSVWVGVDASVKRDSTAVVACAWDDASRKVRLVFHRIFQPNEAEPLDFENTIELTIMQLMRRFAVRAVRYDPYQMQATAQRLRQRDAVPMYEAAQTSGYLTEIGSNLYELIQGRNLVTYPDKEVRLAISRSVAVEGARGWRIAKEKSSHKVDVVIALAMAAHACVQDSQMQATLFYGFDPIVYAETADPFRMSDFDNKPGNW